MVEGVSEDGRRVESVVPTDPSVVDAKDRLKGTCPCPVCPCALCPCGARPYWFNGEREHLPAEEEAVSDVRWLEEVEKK